MTDLTGKRFRSVDSRRQRTVVVTAMLDNGTVAALKNEVTGRTTKVKATRLTSHGGYQALDAAPAPVTQTDPSNDRQHLVDHTLDQHLQDQASGEGMPHPADVQPV